MTMPLYSARLRALSGLLVLLLATACAPRKYLVEKAVTGTIGLIELSPVSIAYVDNEIMRAQETKRAQIMLQTPAVNSMPAGGRVTVHIQTSTIGHANLNSWVFAVENEHGQEILRKAGKFDVPHYNNGRWWNLHLIDIPMEFENFFTLRVFDKVMQRRYDFTVRRNPEWGKKAA